MNYCRIGDPIHISSNSFNNRITNFVSCDDTCFFIHTCHLSIAATPTQCFILGILWIHSIIQCFAFCPYHRKFLRQRQRTYGSTI